MRLFFFVVLVLHGLIHVLGFVKGFQLADVNQLTQPISKPAGIAWLVCAVMFLITVWLLLTQNSYWWVAGGLGILLSQILIFQSWTDAKFGTIANILVAVPVMIAVLNALPSSYINRYRGEVEKALHRHPGVSVLTEQDIAHLPIAVQRYIRYTGSVGKAKVNNFRVLFRGRMKQEPNGKWIDITARQYNFYDDPERLFYIESSLYGIPFDGFHRYVDGNATMQIKIGSLFQIVDAKGEKMTHGEMVTLFNDMCLLAPSTLIDRRITWEEIDAFTVKARFTFNTNTIGAVLSFDKEGKLINFVSEDRYYCADGVTYTSYPWSTPVREYSEVDGRRVVSSADAVWQMPEGEFVYASYTVAELEYNCQEFR